VLDHPAAEEAAVHSPAAEVAVAVAEAEAAAAAAVDVNY
jgi:hypothetical protein